MSEIPRYFFDLVDPDVIDNRRESPDGDYVLYSDYAAALAAKDAELERLRGVMQSSDHESVEVMYNALVPTWTQEEIVKHILYWRAKSDDVFRDKTVKHLRTRCGALHSKLRRVRKAAIEFMHGRRFDFEAGLTKQAEELTSLRARIAELEAELAAKGNVKAEAGRGGGQ